jgi:hypothetical protein
MFMIDYTQRGWWYWLLTACLLTAGVAGYPLGFDLAIALTVVHLIDYIMREQSLSAFTVQVRLAVLLYLLLSYPAPLQFLFWLPVVGIWARTLFGYCLLARTLSLMPWNRRVPFTGARLFRTFFSRPVRGNIMQGLPPLPVTPRAATSS